MPKFSIVMPVYNLRPWLVDAIESVRAQDFEDWELICVDDGSTDGSGEVLDGYLVKESRIHVVHQANGGEGAARNAALEIATGEWLAYLDGDDLWHPQFLSTAVSGMAQFPDAQIVRMAHVDFPDGGELHWPDQKNGFRYIDYSKRLTSDVYSGGFLDAVYLRAAVKNIRFKDYSVGADRVCYNECLAATVGMAASKVVRYAYRRRQGSAYNAPETSRKSISQLSWQMDQWRFWENSGRSVDRPLIRRAAQMLTELHAYSLWSLSAEELWPAWRAWILALRELKSSRMLHGWQRYVVRTIAALPLRVIAWTLCAFPYWLKLKGIHR